MSHLMDSSVKDHGGAHVPRWTRKVDLLDSTKSAGIACNVLACSDVSQTRASWRNHSRLFLRSGCSDMSKHRSVKGCRRRWRRKDCDVSRS